MAEETAPTSGNLNKIIIVAALVVFVISGAVFSVSQESKKPQQTGSDNQSPTGIQPAVLDEIKGSEAFAPTVKALLYGTWSSNKSVIKGINTETGKTYQIAQLPASIKHVSLLPSDKLLFINNLDSAERGSSLATYSVTDKTISTVAKADEGYGIDKYVVSANGKYAIDWEIRPAAGSTALKGGSSKVYGIDLSNPSVKHPIYSEVIDTMHYILAVTNDGKAFFDIFQTDVPLGWANGMSVADYTGANKQDIASMQAGTYGRVAALSPDGKSLAFAGYDGSQGVGTELVNGVKKAIKVSNTVELLDTSTLQRSKLNGFSNQNKYDTVSFDKATGNIAVNQITPPETTTDVYLYTMATKSVAKVLNSTNQTFVTSVSETQGILSTPNKSDTSWGNLGDLNAPSVSSYEAVDLLGSKVTQLSTFDTYMQTIDVVAGSSLQNALVAELDSKSKEDKGLQMYSFQLKPALVADRIAALGDAPVGSDSGEETPGESGKSGSCKPAIYLYPTKTEDVIVKLNLKGDLTYTKPSYPEDGWKVSANPDGKLLYNSEPLDYLYYEMKVNDSDLASVRNNNEGYVVDYSTLGSFFERVLPQLGLNSKETTEYKAYWLKALPKSPYYRVSLVPSSLLDKYAGLNIQPTPDSVLRVTLDFQPLDQKITLKEPHLPSFKRSGFTVVEWAGTFKADKNHPFTCLL